MRGRRAPRTSHPRNAHASGRGGRRNTQRSLFILATNSRARSASTTNARCSSLSSCHRQARGRHTAVKRVARPCPAGVAKRRTASTKPALPQASGIVAFRQASAQPAGPRTRRFPRFDAHGARRTDPACRPHASIIYPPSPWTMGGTAWCTCVSQLSSPDVRNSRRH